jgi:hypothetical protein
MIIKIDTVNKQIIYNEKIFSVDLFAALSMVQVGYKIEVLHVEPNESVTVKLTMGQNESRN